MSFIKNIWYVAAWSADLEAGKLIARQIAGEPIVLWRDQSGRINALEDRCPHRHAPLSLGRLEGEELRCMYHGLRFSAEGKCVHIPGTTDMPPNIDARSFPVIEQDGWVMVWTGDPAKADPALAPRAWGEEGVDVEMDRSELEYKADYQLINDNLTDLSHVDFVHERTLGAATGRTWSTSPATISTLDNGIRVSRWLPAYSVVPGDPNLFETYSSYDYLLPGIFLLRTAGYLPGSAEAAGFAEPLEAPAFERFEQQAVTPIAEGRTLYLFASGAPKFISDRGLSEAFFGVVRAAFAEDRAMIEAQQNIWNATAPDRRRAFIPQDKGPSIFRRLIASRLREEQGGAAHAGASV